jgi:predicted metalloprotease with PDZ domain
MLKIAAEMYRWTQLPTKCGLAVQVLPVLFGWLVFASFSTAQAQIVTARISVISTNPARIRVSAELHQPTRTVSFRQTYAGILGLGERIQSLQAVSGNGTAVSLHAMGGGEFRADEEFARFSYEVDLAPPSRPSQMSHVSWLNQDQGLLFMADLLPQRFDGASISKAQITIEPPGGWSVRGNLSSRTSTYDLNDPESAVFLLSRSIHEKQQRVSSIDVSVILSGAWPVSESEVLKSTTRILKEYLRVTKFTLRDDAFLFLVPYAGSAGPDNWTSETRGNAVVLLLGKNSTAKRVLARLEVVLSHELFHLWVPNSLKLPGAYDWFFEGFTIYQALRTDLRLGFISFEGYLETLARVMDSYMATSSDSLSLLDASEQRWTTSAQTVYEQGMLVAFLYDLTLRKQTGCDESLDDVYPRLFRVTSAGQASANEIIIKLLTEPDGLQTFARDYLERPVKINLDEILSTYGIIQSSGSGPTRWAPAVNLTPAQRKLLGCLGYKK